MPDAQSPPARIAVANKAKCTSYLNPRVLAFMAEHGILITRLALGVIFLWFGILKLATGLSEAEDLAKRTS
jgi:uncharacterized membrane protein YkgB